MILPEEEFHNAMLRIYRRAKDECGYNATRFLQMLAELGGMETARRLLSTDEPQIGFTELWEARRLDLTVEALVLQPEWRDLFSSDQLECARSRLIAHGYDPSPA